MSFVQNLLSRGCDNHNAHKMLQAHGWVGINSVDTLRTGSMVDHSARSGMTFSVVLEIDPGEWGWKNGVYPGNRGGIHPKVGRFTFDNQ